MSKNNPLRPLYLSKWLSFQRSREDVEELARHSLGGVHVELRVVVRINVVLFQLRPTQQLVAALNLNEKSFQPTQLKTWVFQQCRSSSARRNGSWDAAACCCIGMAAMVDATKCVIAAVSSPVKTMADR